MDSHSALTDGPNLCKFQGAFLAGPRQQLDMDG